MLSTAYEIWREKDKAKREAQEQSTAKAGKLIHQTPSAFDLGPVAMDPDGEIKQAKEMEQPVMGDADFDKLFKEVKRGATVLRIKEGLSDAQLFELCTLINNIYEFEPKGRSLLSLEFARPAKIGTNGIKMIARMLIHGKSILESLSLCGQDLGVKSEDSKDDLVAIIANAIAFNGERDTIKFLNLSGNGISNLMPFERVLSTTKCLETLDLSANQIGQSQTGKLARALQGGNNTSLKTLNLSNNFVSSGVIVLAEMLNTNTSLAELDLSNNGILNSGAEALAKALSINRTLQCLKLGRNDLIGDHLDLKCDLGLVKLFKAIKTNPVLKELYLYAIKFGPNTITALSDALDNNQTLQVLNLNENTFSREEAMRLYCAIKESITGLTSLELEYNCTMDADLKLAFRELKAELDGKADRNAAVKGNPAKPHRMGAAAARP